MSPPLGSLSCSSFTPIIFTNLYRGISPVHYAYLSTRLTVSSGVVPLPLEEADLSCDSLKETGLFVSVTLGETYEKIESVS